MYYFSRFNNTTTAICLLRLLSVAAAAAALGNLPTQFYPEDDFAVNCGSSGNSTALDGREWIGDSAFELTSALPRSVVSSIAVHSSFVDSIPYMTARISRSEFTYRFRVKPGQKFIRLHFYPAPYRGFEKSKALFDVRAGPYTFLSNFSASLTADALGVKCFLKEYCLNVEEDNQILSITFSPSQGAASGDVYAFINGIEIVSMPTALYYSGDDDLGACVAGKKYRFYIDSGKALELVHRLNVGGRSILPPQDLGMFRLWSEDKKYLLESHVLPASTTVAFKYTHNWKYAGPPGLYQTAWAMASNPQSNQRCNYTWKLPVDLGFWYLVRLHFCDPKTTDAAGKKFFIFINNQVAESEADVMRWSGGSGIAVYRDYVVSMEGKRMEAKRDLIIVLQPMYEGNGGQIEAMMMNGIEIFKLSNLDNDLAGPNPIRGSQNGTSKLQKLVSALGPANAIATGMFVILTLLNIIVFQLTIWKPNNRQINISSSSSSLPKEDEDEQGCILFSLEDIQLATNNFHERLVIGRGGFGKVYRGLMDGGTKVVAIKRLSPESKQGAEEFWAEVWTLSKFRHPNLVSLLGYYEGQREMLLVYEYVAGGSLADHLYRASTGNSSSDPLLSWEQRLNICIGVARGLSHLHTGRGGQDVVIHRDVKSSNILLDEHLVPKISDFGLCKMISARPSHTHVTTKVKGTVGFLDPDYFTSHRLTFKSDVYAFGVVMLEVVSGRPALDRRAAVDKHCLALWVRQCITEGTLDLIVDPILRGQISGRCLKVFVAIADKCLRNQPNDRPTMSDLVAGLEDALELHGLPDSYAEEEAESVPKYQGKTVDPIVDETKYRNINATPEIGNHIEQGSQKYASGLQWRPDFYAEKEAEEEAVSVLGRQGNFDAAVERIECSNINATLEIGDYIEKSSQKNALGTQESLDSYAEEEAVSVSEQQEAVSVPEHQGSVNAIVGETEHSNINATLEAGDHIEKSRQKNALGPQGAFDSCAKEEAMSVPGQRGSVGPTVEETDNSNINATRGIGDHIEQRSHKLEKFNKNEMDISIAQSKTKGITSPPKQGEIKPWQKWWNSVLTPAKRHFRYFSYTEIQANSVLTPAKPRFPYFSYTEIQAATNNLKHGERGFGNVLFGKMGNEKVAMTISGNSTNYEGKPSWRKADMASWRYAEMLSRQPHANLVSVLGYSRNELGSLILVYDYLSNGSLQNHLYGGNKDPLPWKRRLQICLGAARGLHYIHAEHKIIHRSIKSSSILLDERWVAKIGDFAWSTKFSNSVFTPNTLLDGDDEYLDPECIRTGRLTEKSDVYSFGLVLLEVLCAKPVYDAGMWNWMRCHLVRCVVLYVRHNQLYETLIDPYLKGKIAPACFTNFVDIAVSCLQFPAIERPSMADVGQKLQYVLDLQESMESDARRINFKGQFNVTPRTKSILENSGYGSVIAD